MPLTIGGRAASSTNPSTWSTYADAASSSVGVGLGFVVNGDGIVCLDLDHCITDDGHLLRGPATLLDRLPPTYIERSPSGDGLHVWLRGALPRSGRIRVYGVPVEGYADQRFMTMTGVRWGDCPPVLAEF